VKCQASMCLDGIGLLVPPAQVLAFLNSVGYLAFLLQGSKGSLVVRDSGECCASWHQQIIKAWNWVCGDGRLLSLYSNLRAPMGQQDRQA
jgi:hypothetical protein